MYHSGLVTGGPGLTKRINEALLKLQQPVERSPDALESRRARLSSPWLWALLFGMSMVFGGMLAALIAMTRVVLPYDEAFVGLTRAQISQINNRLLAFMAHDRVTLAGTMVAIGILYAQLALHGIRQQVHWARQVLLISAAFGFASFFLFLGFGYFDPLHAFVSVMLFPMLFFSIRGRRWSGSDIPCADRWNDRAWRLACYGQLLFILLGVGLILAGLTITVVGVTTVFVPEELAFMQTPAATLQAANARLIPMIAHDWAGFGGALVSNGLAVLLLALWGFRRGARWVWWTMLSAGVPGFVAALSVHLLIGYTDLWHLSPALAALVVFILGLSLSYAYLADRDGQRCRGAENPIVPMIAQ